MPDFHCSVRLFLGYWEQRCLIQEGDECVLGVAGSFDYVTGNNFDELIISARQIIVNGVS